MSRHINSHFRDTKLPFQSIKDFNHSVDVKKFSKERNNGTPTHIYSSFHQRIQQRSNDKIRHSQPNSLGSSFAKNISQKNMKTKRKLSSGCKNILTQFKLSKLTIILSASTTIFWKKNTLIFKNCLNDNNLQKLSQWLDSRFRILNNHNSSKIYTIGWLLP